VPLHQIPHQGPEVAQQAFDPGVVGGRFGTQGGAGGRGRGNSPPCAGDAQRSGCAWAQGAT
jgi:hypothetical protein